MKSIALIGATGFVGSTIRDEALSRGHKVKGIIRKTDGVVIENDNLVLVQADVMNTGILAEVLEGSDTVISAYNPGWSNPNIYDDTLKGYRSIIQATKDAGINRLQVVGGAGSLFIAKGETLISSRQVPEKIRPAVESLAKVLTDYLFPEQELDWVFFSPAGELFQGERTGRYRLGKDDMIFDKDGKSRISVQDYAKAMIDELENPRHHCERFTIGY